jgi:hypothetical protein
MVQRLGRVLRPKSDGRAARLVIVFAKDTLEDPANGAHESFLDEILPVAEIVDHVDADDDGGRFAMVFQNVAGSG